ncbi:MAG: hypothetical protein PHN75_16825 [Syntrophales bacterium]|nr:hypothetical protein [Syntrophales bacterium]
MTGKSTIGEALSRDFFAATLREFFTDDLSLGHEIHAFHNDSVHRPVRCQVAAVPIFYQQLLYEPSGAAEVAGFFLIKYLWKPSKTISPS